MGTPWRIELLGGLRVAQGDRVMTRFPAQKAGALLAYLAYHRQFPQPRETLIELLWPESDPELGRRNLRFLLHSLRCQLEPKSPSAATRSAPDSEALAPEELSPALLLRADRSTVWLEVGAFTTDVHEFQAGLEAAATLADPRERAERLQRAVGVYRGELLPGFSDSWVLSERQQLAQRYLQGLRQLIAALEQTGDLKKAVEYARRAVGADPLREEAHYDLMRLYAAAGQPAATLRQYQELERILREQLGETPSAATRALAEELRAHSRSIVVARSSGAREPGPGVGFARKKTADRGVLSDAGRPDPVPSAPSVTPSPHPLMPSSTPKLPVQFTRFFGREEEIARLAEMLRIPAATRAAGGRLVTLTGPGGSGKTRLAIAVAGRLQEELDGAIWYVPLAELTEPRRIADAIREVLGLPAAPGGEPLEQVVAALSGQPSFLVLDNFEQLAEEGAAVVRRLLERVPGLICLVTSRQRLDLAGEVEFVVLPLPTPAFFPPARARAPTRKLFEHEHEQDLPDALLQYPSVALFVDRAQAARPEFRLTVENAPAVASLCDRLEGIPLAIELAAARTGVLTPQQMLARLEHRFDLLVSHRRDISARHRSLRAALEWSHQLLSPALRQFFARLSIFRGGWTLEAAEAVCEEPSALEYLELLRECSLVVAEESGGAMRYELLETLREFAAEQLPPHESRTLEEQYFAYFLAFAEALEQHWPAAGASRPEDVGNWLAQHEAEYSNVRAALEWGLTAAPAAALQMVDWLTKFWYIRGYPTEALEFIRRAAQWRDEDSSELRAKALRYAGVMASELGEYEQAQTILEEVLVLSRMISHPQLIAAALRSLGEVAAEQGEYDRARTLYQESLEIRRAIEGGYEVKWPLAGLGEVARALGEYEAARAYSEQSLAIFRAERDQRHSAQLLRELGFVACCQGEYERAQGLFNESLPIFQQYGDRAGIGLALKGLGDVALARQDYPTAHRCYRECLTLLHALGRRKNIAGAMEGFARLAAAEAQSERACLLLAAARALREAIGSPLPPNEQPEQEALCGALRQAFGAPAFTAAWEAGRSLPFDQVVALALAGADA